MTPTQSFIRAWHAWRRSHLPTDNFRLCRSDVFTYDAELELDHLHSSLYSLGSAIIEVKSWDYEVLASEELAKLERISLEIEGCEVSEDEKEAFGRYISAARSLLAEMKNPFSTDGAV